MNAQDFAAYALLVLAALFVVGCGSTALQVNATVARAMLEVQAESGPTIRQLRIDASVGAAQAVHDSGGDEAAAQLAATTTASRWQCVIDTHRIYSGAVGAYIDTLALWLAGADFELTDGIAFVRRALDAYRALAACTSSLGSDVLPAVPSFLDLLPPTWSLSE